MRIRLGEIDTGKRTESSGLEEMLSPIVMLAN
jgi:hypothetical protein